MMIRAVKSKSTPWWVVRTKPKREFEAQLQLINQGFSIFLPTYKQEQLNNRNLKLKVAALFPRYLFIEANEETKKLIHKIRSTYGVTELLKIGEVPIDVPNKLVHDLKILEEQRANKTEFYFKSGDVVKINSGLYNGLEAIYNEEDGLKRAIVLINILSTETPLNLDKKQLRKI